MENNTIFEALLILCGADSNNPKPKEKNTLTGSCKAIRNFGQFSAFSVHIQHGKNDEYYTHIHLRHKTLINIKILLL